MGTNSKLHVQFKSRFWNRRASTARRTPTGARRARGRRRARSPATSGILVNYTGGNIGASFGSGTPRRARSSSSRRSTRCFRAKQAYNGKAYVDFWLDNRWTKGSYSYWKVGQYTKFAGIERLRQGTCHFAGEHTSIDFQGYLNGAVETGERAASEILGDLK